MECAPELASPNFPGEALCLGAPAFHQACVYIVLQCSLKSRSSVRGTFLAKGSATFGDPGGGRKQGSLYR